MVVRLPRYRWKHLLDAFEIRFTVFVVLFSEYWSLFWVDWRYGCQNTCENAYLTALRLGFCHSLFYFWNIAGYFAYIGCSFAKIRVNTFIRRLWNCVYSFRRYIFRTLEVILCWLEVRLPRYVRKHLFAGFAIGFTTFPVLF